MAAKNIGVGQKWKTRNGRIVRISQFSEGDEYPFNCIIDGDLAAYLVDQHGCELAQGSPSPLDLVELLEPAPAQPEPAESGLEVGQVWLARNGREVRIIAKLDYAAFKDHPWACEDSKGVSYTVNDDGFEFTSEMQTAHDLIERVAHPPLEAYKFSSFKPDRYIRDDALAVFEFAAEPAVPVELAQAPADPVLLDAEALAVETLNGLGFRFDGQCWLQDAVADSPAGHPLHAVFMKAIEQAMFGKGKRHGGAAIPFLDQPWRHYAKMHGRGFLTGQAANKLEEAASTRSGEAFETEVLGALVYIGMAVLFERGEA